MPCDLFFIWQMFTQVTFNYYSMCSFSNQQELSQGFDPLIHISQSTSSQIRHVSMSLMLANQQNIRAGVLCTSRHSGGPKWVLMCYEVSFTSLRFLHLVFLSMIIYQWPLFCADIKKKIKNNVLAWVCDMLSFVQTERLLTLLKGTRTCKQHSWSRADTKDKSSWSIHLFFPFKSRKKQFLSIKTQNCEKCPLWNHWLLVLSDRHFKTYSDYYHIQYLKEKLQILMFEKVEPAKCLPLLLDKHFTRLTDYQNSVWWTFS